MTIGLMASADLFFVTSPEGLHGFVSWQVAAAAFGIASTCLAVGRGAPLPFLKFSKDIDPLGEKSDNA